jgi:excisionase family DNA binding protein
LLACGSQAGETPVHPPACKADSLTCVNFQTLSIDFTGTKNREKPGKSGKKLEIRGNSEIRRFWRQWLLFMHVHFDEGYDMNDMQLMSVKELSKLLGCSRTTIFNIVKRGDIQKIKLGKTVRFDMRDVREMLEKNKQSRSEVAL